MIVEDDGILCMQIQDFLQYEKFDVVDILNRAENVYERAIKSDVSLIIMDINLSMKLNDMSGIALAKQIREIVETPIIFLTAYNSRMVYDLTEEISNSGFLVKPWNEIHLLSWIKKFLNKHQTVICLDSVFSFNIQTLELFRHNQVVPLNKQQSKLLNFFIENNNKLLSHDRIEHHLWEYPVTDSTRIALISKLRKKLDHKFINTFPGRGYIFRY